MIQTNKRTTKRTKIAACFLAALMTASLFTGCGKDTNRADSNSPVPTQNQTADSGSIQNQTEDSGSIQNQTEDSAQGESVDPSGTQNEALAFRPAESGFPALESYEYPYAGMNFALSKKILTKMKSCDVLMSASEDYTSDSDLKYAALSWYSLTEEQKTEEVTGYNPDEWLSKLAKIGTLGVYNVDSVKELDNLSGYTEHKELGKSKDGRYTYYLSTAKNADKSLKKELLQSKITLTDMEKFDLSKGTSAFAEGRVDTSHIGDFQTTDVTGKEYTKELFQNYNLTLVNVFATWCSPCIEEMPELEKLKQEMAKKGVNVVGIVHDSILENGKKDPDAIDKAQLLAQKANLTFPLLQPDASAMNGRLKGIESFPESFFVDRDGNIVGDTYSGTHTFEEWKEIAEKELANLKSRN